MSDDYLQRFSGIARLYGSAVLERFRNAHLAVIGIGGVGSWAAEALARSGIGEFTLVDLDELCLTNVNRQVHALDGLAGRSKVQVMAERIAGINPTCRIHAESCFFTEKTAETILRRSLTGIIDGIDSVRPKCLLLAEARRRGIPIVTTGAAGGRRDATRIVVEDLARTSNDALLLQVRKDLRNHYGFPSGDPKRKKFGIPTVFSLEDPVYPQADGCVSPVRPQDLPSGLRCDVGYGSATHITATFGLFAVGELLKIVAAAP
jgi:tRNA A37 threonylcarbamoyladenosine dehydratase